jgi:hypothetical protein
MTYAELIEKYNIFADHIDISETHNNKDNWKQIRISVTISTMCPPNKYQRPITGFTYYTGGHRPKRDTILKSALEIIKKDIEVSLMPWEEAGELCPDKLDRLNMLEKATQMYRKFRNWNSEVIRELLKIEED